MTEVSSSSSPHAPRLNEFQARRLRVTCQYIDKLLGEIEVILNATASKAAFPRYSTDVAPVQRRTIEDYIARLRAQLLRVLDGQEIPRENPAIPASRAIHVTLGTIDIAVEELKPQYMRGYGDLPETVATELNGISGELRGLVSKLDRYLAEGVGQDLTARLRRLEQRGNDLQILTRIERVVAERGLVEFRASIASILDRVEDKALEIAVLGRVSSGKSSLMNAILDAAVLPVGVTPITAVPTRMVYGEEASLSVSFAEAPTKTMEVARLGEFATEQQNPGNAKRVTRIVVTLPAERLRNGVTFVDTPGLGSLATTGAAETLAYLPKCDLGVVLIDAGATLTTEDLKTILTLQEAAIPVNVLLSKADLLNPEDREKIIRYTAQHIASECSLNSTVHPVSVLSSHKELLNRWFEDQILPLYDRSQELRASSLRRKIAALRESVVATLQIRLQHSGTATHVAREQIRSVEARLRRATGLIEETDSSWKNENRQLARDVSEIFRNASVSLMNKWFMDETSAPSADKIVHDSILQFVQQKMKRLHEALDALAIQLRDDLRTSAAVLGLADVPGEDEFQSLVRGMPILDPVSLNASESRPALAALLGRRFTERRVAKRLRKELGESLNKSLNTYSNLLEEWTGLITGQLLRRFDTYAEAYRGQAERSLGGTDLTSEEVRSIQESLSFIEAPDFGGVDAEVRGSVFRQVHEGGSI
jgi:GTP-binding protein EngB required for normal cell division